MWLTETFELGADKGEDIYVWPQNLKPYSAHHSDFDIYTPLIRTGIPIP